jgi:hypothetical protein
MDAKMTLTHCGGVAEALMNGLDTPAQLDWIIHGCPIVLRPMQ